MKKGLLIIVGLMAVVAAGAFIYDAMQAKPERSILVEENYRPPARDAVASPSRGGDDLTPLPPAQ